MIDRAQQYLVERHLLDHPLTWQEAVQRAPAGVAGASGDAVTAVLGAIAGVAGGVFGVVTILILTFYMLVESDSILATIARLFPRDRRARFADVSRRISTKVSAWLGGQLLLAAVIGTSATIGLWLLGVPYFFVLGLIAGVGELIPMVGPLLGAIPALAVALSVSPGKALAVAVFFVVQQQVENHVLVPKIMSKQVGVSAVTVLVALLLGASLLGIVGALLAVPTAAVLQVVFQEFAETGEA
jgi:predicted PurR-regulated permease PerM